MKPSQFDTIIVGSGPAGLFACLELIKNKYSRPIALFEMGQDLKNRKTHHVMSGFGGAGTYSDGKLHYTPKLSHERVFHLITPQKYQLILNHIEKTFKNFGVDAPYYPKNPQTTKHLIEEAERHNIELIVRKAQHVGSNKLKSIIQNLHDHLVNHQVTIFHQTQIKDLITNSRQITGIIDSKKNSYHAPNILLAPGRIGAKWLQELSKKHQIKHQYGMVEVGVRVEFPESVMSHYAENLYEIVLKIRTKTYDDIIRTFCSCPNGYVTAETYRDYVCVNGHSNSNNESPNSNFAFVCEVHLTEPVENSIAYAKSIAELASTIGGGQPILQRLADLKKGRRSTWSRLKKSLVKPSLTKVTPGDISMVLPHRTVTNILEGLEILDQVMPGINSGSTLLYAPEVKFRSSQVETDNHLQTSVKGLYVAGDASGLSGSITGAAATGIRATRGILKSKA
jgi:uncharacterized FAD-dependent dehydrogenase